MARIILVSRESVKPDFHFMINWLRRCGILVVGLLGWGGFPEGRVAGSASCSGSGGLWLLAGVVGGLSWVLFGHKKTGTWPVLLFLFAGGSEEKCLERVAGIEPA